MKLISRRNLLQGGVVGIFAGLMVVAGKLQEDHKNKESQKKLSTKEKLHKFLQGKVDQLYRSQRNVDDLVDCLQSMDWWNMHLCEFCNTHREELPDYLASLHCIGIGAGYLGDTLEWSVIVKSVVAPFTEGESETWTFLHQSPPKVGIVFCSDMDEFGIVNQQTYPRGRDLMNMDFSKMEEYVLGHVRPTDSKFSVDGRVPKNQFYTLLYGGHGHSSSFPQSS